MAYQRAQQRTRSACNYVTIASKVICSPPPSMVHNYSKASAAAADYDDVDVVTCTPGPALSRAWHATSRLPQAKRKLDLESPPTMATPRVPDEGSTPKRGRPPSSSSSSSGGGGKRKLQTRGKLASPERTRFDTSLGLLTRRFVGMLRSSPDGVLDLNVAVTTLDVQKRRIYDITNVLEGIRLIQKESKNKIRWRGCSVGEQQRAAARQTQRRREIADMEAAEGRLDEMIAAATLQLRLVTEDAANRRLAYVAYRDIRRIPEFREQTVIAVRAPPETRLEVPLPGDVVAATTQMSLRSERGEIDVYLCPEEEGASGSEELAKYSRARGPGADDESRGGDTSQIERILTTPCGIRADNTPTKRGRACVTVATATPSSSCGLGGATDFSPLKLFQTEDQYGDDGAFVQLEPPITDADYTFTLEESEGISDLFDAAGVL
ncbi:PREDICTED: transcription factor E2F3-like [Priapulus caudatus]|uniref:Transcription factor E2F3-like n=1 Tax=Priapulus caudatus TaxID=37621 RepID=A0ABM1EGV7_PRICU|nr:PREDICTED: transcription factor E2F3-like [Priapulus caudatus]